ncbi:MAG: hypothetical protein BMS9Abin02_1061 [Anaerolineae bacterium]|nr:MAG: hypothetical protein BMS9Abin02_1061 [Anaerolineae bacterium]
MFPFDIPYVKRTTGLISLGLVLFILVSSCSDPGIKRAEPISFSVTVSADGESNELLVETGTVRTVLEEMGIILGDLDMVDPPLFTPITKNLSISVIRVSESLELVKQTVPFRRRTVRNESMSATDPPLIIQAGFPGSQEVTVRIIFHDGLEFSRQETQVNLIEPPQDEIVMIGVGAAPGNVDFPGVLAYINGGNSVILRGSTAFPEQLITGGELDHRVYRLSPTGNYLLFTKASEEEDNFNTLWVVSTERDAKPLDLEVENVLWADWNPSRIDQPQIAFSKGISTDLLPGWEANNDLWIGEIPLDPEEDFEPERVIEAYPATYGWWGGNYAWSPNGRYIAYAFADEVGIIDIEVENIDDDGLVHSRLTEFTEYNTRGDWVWVPNLSWSPDSQYLVFSQHAGEDPNEPRFDTWASNVFNGSKGLFVNFSGIWSYPYWSPSKPETFDPAESTSQIAYLRATDSLDSQRSSYTLWLMDRDGSNTLQIYPPVGENSRFSQDKNFMSWGPFGDNVAFIFDEQLWILNLDSLEAKPVAQDDNLASNPTWAPYGLASTIDLSEVDAITLTPRPTRIPTPVPEELEPVE